MNNKNEITDSRPSRFSNLPLRSNNLPPSLATQSNNTNKASSNSHIPLENAHLTRNVSYFSEYAMSFTTEQISHSNRESTITEETTEITSPQFRFEKKVQNALRLLNLHQKFCSSCKTNTYFSVRYELQDLNFFQFINYWIQTFKCCNESMNIEKYHIKKLYCVYCGNDYEI